MFFSIVKWVILSLTLIFLIHHLYIFLMNVLTVPKIKDLVNKPNQQYKDIMDTLQHTKAERKEEDTMMTSELSSFLNDLKKTPVPSGLGANASANEIGSNANEIGSNANEIGSNANEIGSNANEIGATSIDSLNFNNISYSPY
jgi:hypothetical protein